MGILQTPQHKTAVLIFAAASQQECRRKNMRNASTLFDGLTNHSIDTVKNAGLPYVLVTGNNQEGNTFGQRLENAMESVFNLGYTGVIAIGNDTPHLSKQHLLQAVHNLERGKVTVGPSYDGGFYLLALDKFAFAKAKNASIAAPSFAQLNWQTSSLLTQLITCLATPVRCLEKLRDLDSLSDAQHLYKSTRVLNATVMQLLLLVILQQKPCNNHKNRFIPLIVSGVLYNKGSPY